MTATRIGEHMIRYPQVVAPEQGVLEALEMMQDLGVRHLPVVSEEKLVGIVSERDLKAARAPLLQKSTIAEIMKKDVYVVSSQTPLSEVASDMADGKYGSAIVTDVNRQVIGIFTTTDALRILSNQLDTESMEDYFLDETDYEDGSCATLIEESYYFAGNQS
jgi:CBS domain-containing protein